MQIRPNKAFVFAGHTQTNVCFGEIIISDLKTTLYIHANEWSHRIYLLNHKLSIGMCCIAMNWAEKKIKTAVIFRDRLPPFKSIIIWSEMANIGNFNTQSTFGYKDMDLYNWNKIIWSNENK